MWWSRYLRCYDISTFVGTPLRFYYHFLSFLTFKLTFKDIIKENFPYPIMTLNGLCLIIHLEQSTLTDFKNATLG